jgi:hypothetical protein
MEPSPELSPELLSPTWSSPEPQLGVSERVGSLSLRHDGFVTLRAGFFATGAGFAVGGGGAVTVGDDTVVTTAVVFVTTMVGVPDPPARVASPNTNTNAPTASAKTAAPTPVAFQFIRASEPAEPSQLDRRCRSADRQTRLAEYIPERARRFWSQRFALSDYRATATVLLCCDEQITSYSPASLGATGRGRGRDRANSLAPCRLASASGQAREALPAAGSVAAVGDL